MRLRVGHCAVDPRRIPYGSKVVFVDGVFTAVDTGGAVISRKAARRAGRTPAERNALVVDRFFETKRQALSWANAHPAFMTVQVIPPNYSRAGTALRPQLAKQAAPQPARQPAPQLGRVPQLVRQSTPQLSKQLAPKVWTVDPAALDAASLEGRDRNCFASQTDRRRKSQRNLIRHAAEALQTLDRIQR